MAYKGDTVVYRLSGPHGSSTYDTLEEAEKAAENWLSGVQAYYKNYPEKLKKRAWYAIDKIETTRVALVGR